MPLSRISLAARAAAVLALTTSFALLVRWLLGSPSTGIDDADIFLVYARNVSAGQGFVFNTGGEHVEGFTSLLWVLICALTVRIAQNPEPALLALSIGFLAATLAECLGCSLCRRQNSRDLSPGWSALLLMLLLSDPRFVLWNTVTLMETPLWCLLVTTSTLLVLRSAQEDQVGSYLLAGVSGLLVLTRPEALFWVPLLGLLVFVLSASQGDTRRGFRRALPVLVAFGVTTVCLTAFRLTYFGYPLPNTYYAKVSPSFAFTFREGTTYLGSYLSSGPVPALAALSLAISWAHLARRGCRNEATTVTLTALGTAGLALPILSGGDHFGGFRFYQAIYPILVLNLINTGRSIGPHYVRLSADPVRHRYLLLAGSAGLATVFVAYQGLQWTDFSSARLMVEFRIAEAGRARGRNADAVFSQVSPRPSIATVTVGGLQYGYSGPVIDLMGLNSVRMAHNGGKRFGLKSHAAFEKDTFYKLNPQILVPLAQIENNLASLQKRTQQTDFVDAVLKGLLQDQAFRDAYQLAEVRRTSPVGTVALAGYFNKRFLAELRRSASLDVVTAHTED